MRSIIELGRNLGLQVVAEGVEEHATWEHLWAAHCDAAQGHYVSRPLPPREAQTWLLARTRQGLPRRWSGRRRSR
jgi:EAL domain-containing protein (putative c-di-GMP-specific phosphodiesterase class I)